MSFRKMKAFNLAKPTSAGKAQVFEAIKDSTTIMQDGSKHIRRKLSLVGNFESAAALFFSLLLLRLPFNYQQSTSALTHNGLRSVDRYAFTLTHHHDSQKLVKISEHQHQNMTSPRLHATRKSKRAYTL